MATQIEIVNNHNDIAIRESLIETLTAKVLVDEDLAAREVYIVFVDDAYLRQLHRNYLDDDTVTDVMTFNLSDDEAVEGEIYISLDRAKAHAAEFSVAPGQEVARLVIHGLLHLNGYDDKTAAEQKKMRQQEEHYLNKYEDLTGDILNPEEEEI